MTRMFFSSQHCQGVDLDNGHHYNTDRSGLINVTDHNDVKALAAAGYVQAGGMPRFSKYWECECGWESAINSCPKCQRTDLTKVEK